MKARLDGFEKPKNKLVLALRNLREDSGWMILSSETKEKTVGRHVERRRQGAKAFRLARRRRREGAAAASTCEVRVFFLRVFSLRSFFPLKP